MTVRLGLDASLRIPSCAILVDGELTLTSTMGNPVEGFPRVIRESLERAGLQFGDVDEIVACVGPGSYMGVRTAVSTANALALAIGRPVSGVLSVDALAVTAPTNSVGTVAVPAGRGRWFVAGYRRSGEMLHRDGLPQLVDRADPDAWRACEPDGETTDECGGLIAQGAVIVAEGQRHLVTEAGGSEVSPHLPPPSLRGAR